MPKQNGASVATENIASMVGTLKVAPQRLTVGISTVLGVLAGIGAVIAAVHGNDVATAVGGAATSITMAGRYGQAIVREARVVARGVLPYVEAAAELPDPPAR